MLTADQRREPFVTTTSKRLCASLSFADTIERQWECDAFEFWLPAILTVKQALAPSDRSLH